jgi:endonuclease III
MSKETQISLSDKEKNKLLIILEKQGKTKWFKRWKEHMAFPNNINPLSTERNEQEKALRYLLLRVLINQQARFEKVREMSLKISEEFTDVLLFEPYKVPESELFKVFKNVAGEKGSLLYKVGKLGGIKPISLFTYRFKAYEGFIKWLNETNQTFFDLIVNQLLNKNAFALFEFLNTHPILEAGWVGNDPKACRMFVNWVIFLFNEIWKQEVSKTEDTLMIVDGHVGKVFCRTGLLGEVLYEKNRPYIIQASKMRLWIEEIVSNSRRVPFYVDNGAFYLFEDGFCTDLSPNCKSCPINKLCKKYIKWTAYQKWEGKKC